MIKYDADGVRSVIYSGVVRSIENTRRLYFTDKPIDLLDKWSMSTENEDLLGIFAISYSDQPAKPLSERQMTNF